MHDSVKNLTYIENKIKGVINSKPTIIAVSKTFSQENIKPLLEFGHLHYGENKVQECVNKWHTLKLEYNNVKLHMLGKLQTNKVRDCVKYFDFIHSLDSKKLAKKISDEQLKINKKVKIFIQVNIGEEQQKSGVNKNNLNSLLSYCNDLNLDVIGLMCIPPANIDPENYFNEMKQLNNTLDLTDLSMGMSSDYIKAPQNLATYIRIVSSIFGKRF